MKWYQPPSEVVVPLAALALFGAFIMGRTTAPTKTITIEREKSGQGEVVAKANDTASHQAAAATGNQVTVWRTRWLKRPDGTEERTQEASTATASTTSSEASAVNHAEEVNEKIRWLERENVSLKESAKPNWSIEARAGLDLSLHPKYEAEIARRIVGGVWLTASVDASAKAALVGVRVDF